MLDEIPQFLSISLAAALAGLSRKSFCNRFLSAGLVKLSWQHLWRPPDTGRGFIYLSALEHALGRKLTLKDIHAAEKRLEPARRRARAYQQKRRNQV
jgi:hypothetical protein